MRIVRELHGAGDVALLTGGKERCLPEFGLEEGVELEAVGVAEDGAESEVVLGGAAGDEVFATFMLRYSAPIHSLR